MRFLRTRARVYIDVYARQSRGRFSRQGSTNLFNNIIKPRARRCVCVRNRRDVFLDAKKGGWGKERERESTEGSERVPARSPFRDGRHFRVRVECI